MNSEEAIIIEDAFLTEQLKDIYQMRVEQQLTFAEIGEVMHLSTSRIQQCFREAERRLHEYARYQEAIANKDRDANFSLTLAELYELNEALLQYRRNMVYELRNLKNYWRVRAERRIKIINNIILRLKNLEKSMSGCVQHKERRR